MNERMVRAWGKGEKGGVWEREEEEDGWGGGDLLKGTDRGHIPEAIRLVRCDLGRPEHRSPVAFWPFSKNLL